MDGCLRFSVLSFYSRRFSGVWLIIRGVYASFKNILYNFCDGCSRRAAKEERKFKAENVERHRVLIVE